MSTLIGDKLYESAYRVIKSRISEDENLDDLLLMCERGVKKYDETGSFFKWFRIIIIGFGLYVKFKK